MTLKIVGSDNNVKNILGRGCMMHQRQEIQSNSQELMNITERIMAIG